MANLRTIQFLRNANLSTYSDMASAKKGLIAKAQQLQLLDGSPIAGRYTVTVGESTEVRTILGVVYVNGNTTGVTFFNNDKEFENVLDGLDYGPIGGTDSSVLTQIQQADGKISGLTANVGTLKLTEYAKGSDSGSVVSTDSINQAIAKLENQIDAEEDAREAAIEALDYNLAADDNKVLVSLNQTDGAVSGTSVNISGIKLAGYAEASSVADVATGDTLGEALGKLQKTIHEMDKAASAENGKVVTTVSESDGVVSETKTNVKDLQLGGYSKTNDTGSIASDDTINVALSKLENKTASITINDEDGSINVTPTVSGTDISVNIKTNEHVLAKDGDAGVYTDIKLSGITPSSTTVKEEFALIGTDGSQLGASIKVYKDSSVVSIEYITDSSDIHDQNLKYTYIDVSGNTQTEYVDISSLVLEAEFASGITVTDHVAHGVVDPSSEAFLTVGANGFKLSGVQDAIDGAVNALDAVESGATTHISVTVGEADGVLTAVTVTEDDIASAQAVAEEFAALSGNSSSVSGDTSIEGAKRYADAILANSVAGLDADVSGNSTHVTVGVEEVDGKITAVTVSESNIANANDLEALSGKTVTAITSNNGSIAASIDDAVGNKTYNIETDASKISGLTAEADITSGAAKVSGVSATDSVQTGIENLYASLKSEIAARKSAISGRTITSANGGIAVTETPNEDGFASTIELTLSASNDSGRLTIENDGLKLSNIYDCGTFD